MMSWIVQYLIVPVVLGLFLYTALYAIVWTVGWPVVL